MHDLTSTALEHVRPDSLRPYSRNARTHSRRQIKQIAASIKRFGFNNPVLVDDSQRIIAGHGRVEAAKLLGMNSVPVRRLAHMTEAEIRAYVIADNRLAEKAGWDRKILSFELQALVELDFDIELTGFEMAELDLILGEAAEAGDPAGSPDDAVPAPAAGSPVSRLGDIWRLGDHRLLCGDSRAPEIYTALMTGEQVALVLTDPPYNVPYAGHVGGKGAVRHREFAMASGEMTLTQFTAFLRNILENAVAVSRDGSLHLIFMDWRHMPELLEAGHAVYSELLNLCVWTKTNAGMGSLYRSQHELCFVWKHGTAAHVNNVELGKHGRNRSNVWTYQGANTFRKGRMEDLASHPTVNPSQ